METMTWWNGFAKMKSTGSRVCGPRKMIYIIKFIKGRFN